MFKSTKIVATISDKRCDVDFIRDLYNEGMNVVRMNSAHLQQEGFLKIINNVLINQIRILKLINNNVDFKQKGWVNKASEILKLKPQYIKKFIRINFNDFWIENIKMVPSSNG